MSLIAVMGLLSACSIDTFGTAVSEDAALDTAPPALDAGGGDVVSDRTVADVRAPTDAPADAITPPHDATCTPDGSLGCFVVPAGWSLVAADPTSAGGCPSGFANPSPFQSGPSAGASACACGGCLTPQAPRCDVGPILLNFDHGGGLCGTIGTTSSKSDGTCGTDLYTGDIAGTDRRYTPPGPTGGQCASPGVPNKANVTYAWSARVCTVGDPAAAGCSGSTCAPQLGAPYEACIVAAGDRGCPPGPFSVKRLAGNDVAYSCGPCACTLTATCTGVLTLYTSTTCSGGMASFVVDDQCRPSGFSGSYGSYRYASSLSSTCSAQGPSQPGAATMSGTVQTICCAQ